MRAPLSSSHPGQGSCSFDGRCGRCDADPFTLGFLEFHGTKEVIKVVGYDSDLGGGPWDLGDGRVPQADDEVVLDRLLHAVTVSKLGTRSRSAGGR